MKKKSLKIKDFISFRALAGNGVLFSFLLWGAALQAQTRVSSSIDSTQIRIGEQIHFKVEVETDTSAWVVFPEGQTFSPLEVVEEFPVDTIMDKDKFNLIKKYALTQFDSGSYTLPRQQLLINETPYFTDSVSIEVRTVVVDTTKQKMFDIKPIVEVEKTSGGWVRYLLYGLLILVLAGVGLYWFVFRKKPLTEAEKETLLPPYDRAILALKRLDESRHLIQAEYKAYYSQLTNIVRSYLEEDAHISALESTTDELVVKLELLKDSGELNIDESTIKQFKQVLQTADLVKFARSQPETRVAEDHRKLMGEVVTHVKEALPEPTEEELLKDEEYLAALARKKRRKRIIFSAVAVFAILVITSAGFIWHYGFTYIKDSFIGHPTKELLEGEWIASEYGYPAMYIETPKVLKRAEMPMSEALESVVNTQKLFMYGSLVSNFYILLQSTTYKQGVELDMQKAIDGMLAGMEAQGAKNIIVKQEGFVTPTGTEGIKVFGSVNREVPGSKKQIKGEYIILNFMQNGNVQQLVIVYERNDSYAEQIVNRITNSIDFKAGI